MNELAKSDSDFLQIRGPTAFAAKSSLGFVHAVARCASDDREEDREAGDAAEGFVGMEDFFGEGGGVADVEGAEGGVSGKEWSTGAAGAYVAAVDRKSNYRAENLGAASSCGGFDWSCHESRQDPVRPMLSKRRLAGNAAALLMLRMVGKENDIMKYIGWILCLVLLVTLTACGDGAAPPSKPTAIRNWETEIGFVLQPSARLLMEREGGRRDASFGFYEWVFESAAPIDMPKLKAPGVKDYLSLPLDSSTAFVESLLDGRKITKPTTALGSEWSAHGAMFRGTLVRTAQADFLIVERFRK